MSFAVPKVPFPPTVGQYLRWNGTHWEPVTMSNSTLATMAALTVKANATNATADPQDVAATAGSGAVLRESGSTIGFGTIATAGIADGAITPAKIATAAGGALQSARNVIVNGNFDVWQRGTSFAAIGTTRVYSADRFSVITVGAARHTASQSTDVPTFAQSGLRSNYSLLVDCTTANAAPGVGDNTMICHGVEGFDVQHLLERQVTLSFWVKATKTGIHCVALRSSGLNRSYVAEYTISVTATWEKKTITLTFDAASAGTWNLTTGTGIQIDWTLASGSTFHGAAGAWATANLLATANQVNQTDSIVNDFRLAQVQLELGATATPFEIENFAATLDKCQRFYAKSFPYAVTPVSGELTGRMMLTQIVAATAVQKFYIGFPCRMGISAAATLYNPGDAAGGANPVRNETVANNCVTAQITTEVGIVFDVTGSAGSALGNALSIQWSASAEALV